MLEGITVLSQEEMMVMGSFHQGVFWITFCVFFSFITIHAIKSNKGEPNYIVSEIVIGLFISLLPALIAPVLFDDVHMVPTGKYEYTVTIDDSVSFTEFTDRYTIIEQNGDVFVIKEK